MGLRRHLLVLAPVLLAVVIQAPPAAPGDFFLPRTGSDKIRALMDPGASGLPGGFRLVSASVQQLLIQAEYQNRVGARFTVYLRHPSASEGAHAVTRRFSIWLQANPTPAHLRAIDGLVAQVRANEGSWEWVLESAGHRRGHDESPDTILVVLLAASVVLAVLFHLWARRFWKKPACQPES